MKGNRFDWNKALSTGVQLQYPSETNSFSYNSFSVGKFINGLCLCDCYTSNNCGGGFWNNFGSSALPQLYNSPDEVVATDYSFGNQGCICKCRTRRRGCYQNSFYGANRPSSYWPALGWIFSAKKFWFDNYWCIQFLKFKYIYEYLMLHKF